MYLCPSKIYKIFFTRKTKVLYMAVAKRLIKVAKELNVGIVTIVEFLNKKGFELEANPNAKVPEEMLALLSKEFRSDQSVKEESERLGERKLRERKSTITIDDLKDRGTGEEGFETEKEEAPVKPSRPKVDVKVVGKIDLDKPSRPKEPPVEKVPPVEPTMAPEVAEATKVSEPAPKETKTAEEVEQPQKREEPQEKVDAEDTQVPASEEAIKVEPEPVSEVEKESGDEVDIPVQVDKPGNGIKVVGKIDIAPEPRKKKSSAKKKPPKAGEVAEKQKPVKPAPEKETVQTHETPADEKVKDSDAVTESVEALPPTEIKKEEVAFMPTKVKKLSGPTVVGKIELPADARGDSAEERKKKKKRKRIRKEKERVNIGAKQQPGTAAPAAAQREKKKKVQKVRKRPARPEVSEEDVQKQIKETLARLTSKGKSKSSRYRREKRDADAVRHQEEMERMTEDEKILRVTEFLTANELANLMDVQVTQVIATCMSLGMFVSINQRLDAETISLVAEEYGFTVEFISVDVAESIDETEDAPEDLKPRPAIITVMGHVDHGKTSLLDYIRSANVIAGEAGGITQHIGAYNMELENGRQITFLDTPGHEAFTAMRARGAQVTDIAIIIVAADDNVMPQTVEAINHASAAGVPIVFAINKIDRPNANPEKIKEELANMNYLVEEWGGKYQSQDISAKSGTNVDLLLEKVLLEADMLELQANPDKPAVGTVIESSLDKGRGFVTTLLVQAGTLRVGDLLLSGEYYGHVKAMFNERNKKVDTVGPSEPALILGLNGAPQAGEKFHVMENERETREIATKRSQLQREQGLRTQKHITLDEIGRRIAIGNFQELNLIVKGDVDGSIEALSDSLIKLSTEEIQVNVIHKAVGQISESDIMLAAASNAIVIGFQVRPSLTARKLAEKEEIDIRLYSIIYDAIEEITAAMEGMLSPEIKEKITATVEIRDVFKITKVGTVAGCMVKEGKVKRNSKARVIRDGIVVYTGELASLKRFKEDVKEVAAGYECGLNIQNFNDIKVGDVIETYEEVEVSRTL